MRCSLVRMQVESDHAAISAQVKAVDAEIPALMRMMLLISAQHQVITSFSRHANHALAAKRFCD